MNPMGHWCGAAAVALAALVLLAAPSCESQKEEELDGQSAHAVSAISVQRGDLIESVTLLGELRGVEEVRVLPMVTDTVRRLPVREGDVVRAGEVLAIVASELTSQAVEQADAALEAATANRDALEREVGRIRPLVEAGSAPRSQLDSLEAQLRAARAQVRQAAAGAGQASVQQGRSVIRSPIAGVVSGINVQEGEIASPQMPLLTVVQPDDLKVVLRAPERHFQRVAKGMPVVVSPLTDPQMRVDATVTLKGSVVDRMTRTGLIEVAVDNSEGHLVPGSLVRTTVEISRKSDVILVPAEAILFTGETELSGRAMAFIAEDDVASRRDVVLGERQGDLLEVRQGLSEGEHLITRGAHFLRDGASIRVMRIDGRSSSENPSRHEEREGPSPTGEDEVIGGGQEASGGDLQAEAQR